MKSNTRLQRDVLDELSWDPGINAANINVTADDGTVILSGTIGSYTELYAAQRDARRVRDVLMVVDHLEVRLPPADQRTDADLGGAAMDVLRWNARVPAGCVSVVASNGHLTLTGEVMYQFQRQAADDAVRSLVGVRSVDNQIRITPTATADDVRALIEQALVRNAHTDARNIHIETATAGSDCAVSCIRGRNTTRPMQLPGLHLACARSQTTCTSSPTRREDG